MNDLQRIREAREVDRLRLENRRLREALIQLSLTLNPSDPFTRLFFEDYGDLLPLRPKDDAA